MNSTSKKKKSQKETTIVTHCSQISFAKKDLSIPSQNVSHNFLMWARNLPSNSQKMVFTALQYLMIQELQGLFEK